MKSAVSTTGLVKKYGSNRALDGLTASIPSYSITGMVGANGAGKTTWMMSIAGFLRTNAGSINLLGGGPFDPEIHRGRISILPQDSDLPKESYPLETLVHYGRLQGLKKREAVQSARNVLEAVNLGDRMKSPIRSLSHGMRKRVMIAQCFIGHPELVLLDEPLSGLDPREGANMRRFITAKEDNQTIIISSHNLHDLELLCDYIVFIRDGKTARTAVMEELTGKTEMLSYTLAQPPESIDELKSLLPECTFSMEPGSNLLSCRFSSAKSKPEQINSVLIPHLLAHAGIVTIERGVSLEKRMLEEM